MNETEMNIKYLTEFISPKFTENVILDIIRKKINSQEIELKSFEIICERTKSRKGDSYLSQVCRFIIEATTGDLQSELQTSMTIPVIVKSLPKNVARRKTFRCAEFFDNEILFYEKVWPVFQNFQDSKNINNKFDSIPKILYGYIDGEHDFVAMEDLGYDGFKPMDRTHGLDEQHTMVILKLFAQFHAISLAMKDQEPDQFRKAAYSLKETYFSERLRPWYIEFQKRLLNVIRDAVEKELPSKYTQELNKFLADDFFGRLCSLCNVDGPLSAVTHGDSWIPNFLVKYHGDRKDQIAKMIIIDFQLTRYSNLANDITFFLLTCAEIHFLEKNWDCLITEYWKFLGDYLEQLGSNRELVSLNALQHNIHESICFGVGMSLEALCMSLLDDDEVYDIDGVKGDQAVPLEKIWDIQLLTSKDKRRRIAGMIKFVIDRKYFIPKNY